MGVAAELDRLPKRFFRLGDSAFRICANRRYSGDLRGIERLLVLHVQQNDLSA
jgi:hypothetical protein